MRRNTLFRQVKFLVGLSFILSIALLSVNAVAKNPYTRANNTWISISGTVKSVAPDSFILNFGKGTVTVEMDDGDRDADGYKLVPGDKVTVNGKIDDDLYETTSIEASSVYVEKLGTYFYASAEDEEDFVTLVTPVVVSATTVQGTVTTVGDHEFTIDTALKSLTVDVSNMTYDPLDDEGYQKIEVGDLVRVSGSLDETFFAGRKLMAETIIELAD